MVVFFFHYMFFKFSVEWRTYKIQKDKMILNKTEVTKSKLGKKILNLVFIPSHNGLAITGCAYPMLLFQDTRVAI